MNVNRPILTRDERLLLIDILDNDRDNSYDDLASWATDDPMYDGKVTHIKMVEALLIRIGGTVSEPYRSSCSWCNGHGSIFIQEDYDGVPNDAECLKCGGTGTVTEL